MLTTLSGIVIRPEFTQKIYKCPHYDEMANNPKSKSIISVSAHTILIIRHILLKTNESIIIERRNNSWVVEKILIQATVYVIF